MSTVPPELITAYLQTASTKLESLDQLWEQAMAAGWDGPSVEQLIALAHRIAGSGGSYGFPELSTAARHLELMLKDLESPADKLTELQAARKMLQDQLSVLSRMATED